MYGRLGEGFVKGLIVAAVIIGLVCGAIGMLLATYLFTG